MKSRTVLVQWIGHSDLRAMAVTPPDTKAQASLGSDSRRGVRRDGYGREHIREMASPSAAEISNALSPWLEHALRYWRDHWMGDEFLAEIALAEYVSIVDSWHCRENRYFNHVFGRLSVDRYPGNGNVGYDDLYERMLTGFSAKLRRWLNATD